MNQTPPSEHLLATPDMGRDVEPQDDLSDLITGDLLLAPVKPLRPWYLPIKAVLDAAVALLLIIPAAPIICLAALAVKFSSPGPAIYKQKRVGRHGRVFTLLKLRTMVHNAEALTGPVWASDNDPRVTRLGKFLRESHIDEFPQLVNVLLGDMSLVGPRPERPEFMARLDRHVPRYVERLAVRPGITGLTQLRLPPDTDTEGVRRKLVFDLYYVRHVNFWLDTRAMFFTGFQLIQCLLAVLFTPLLGLPRWETVTGQPPLPEPTPPRTLPAPAAHSRLDVIRSQDASGPRLQTAHAPENTAAIINAFTIDVEDYYQVRAFSESVDPKDWDNYESRVVGSTHQILRLLEDHSVRATFFVLGWIADRHPQLVRDIQASGHEIGVHGFWHRCIFEMTPDEFRDDLRQSIDVVEDLTGEPVRAFRAPNFSITAESLWALDILIECGIRYDSSIFPVYHDTYGIPTAERFPHLIERAGGSLWEFPPSVYPLWKFNLPVAGGGYFRLYPSRLSLQWLDHINETERQPFMFYMHPWELDPDQPRLSGSLRSRFRHYQNLRSTAPKLKRLLSSFQFGTLTESLEQAVGPTSFDTTSGLVHADS